MKFIIRHDIKGRLRVHLMQESMTYRQADTLAYYLENVAGVTSAKVYDRTADAVICYTSSKNDIIKAIKAFQYASVEVPANYLENSGRALNAMYQEKLADRILWRIFSRCLIPVPVRNVITAVKSVRYIWNGIKTLCKGRIEVPVLDGTAIGVSVFRGDFATAGSVMFLLGIGELLEEWTHKKSVDDLARSMSLNIDKVWLLKDGTEVLIPASKVEQNDLIVVHMGNVIPFDGDVVSGEGMVNQATLTGESNPVRKAEGGYVYAVPVFFVFRCHTDIGNDKFIPAFRRIPEGNISAVNNACPTVCRIGFIGILQNRCRCTVGIQNSINSPHPIFIRRFAFDTAFFKVGSKKILHLPFLLQPFFILHSPQF